MMDLKFVFTVSLVAIMAVTAANAEIASTDYVNDATLTIQKNGTDVGEFSANASEDKTINITVPTGTLASKNAVTSDLITDKTIVNADISDSAAIAQSKISGLTSALDAKQDATTAVKHTENAAVGGETLPVYVASTGQATVVKGTSVPVGAKTVTDPTAWASIWIEE